MESKIWTHIATGTKLTTDKEKLDFVNKLTIEQQLEIQSLKNKIDKYEKYLYPSKPIPKNTKSKALELHKQGLSYRAIAKELGISKSSVGNILNE